MLTPGQAGLPVSSLAVASERCPAGIDASPVVGRGGNRTGPRGKGMRR